MYRIKKNIFDVNNIFKKYNLIINRHKNKILVFGQNGQMILIITINMFFYR